MDFDYDIVIIGSGPAGQRAALQASKAGKKAAIVEQYKELGGFCVHDGTLPSKSFRESVYRWSLGSKGTLGQKIKRPGEKIDIDAFPDMARLLERRDRVIKSESEIVYNQLNRNKVAVKRGKGRIKSKHEVEVKTEFGVEILKTAKIFIATGARPACRDTYTIDGKAVFDSNCVLNMKRMPRSMIVLGAGVIGCEYASMFMMCGTKVFLIDKRHEVLANVDREIVAHMLERFNKWNMELLLEKDVSELKVSTRMENGVELPHVTAIMGDQTIEAEVCFIAQGRQGNIEGLGLDEMGIEHDARGTIKVDRYYRTNVDNIYAVGDIVGFPGLASTSMEQGRVACCHAFDLHGDTSGEMPELYPYGIYTIPEISTLGKTEEELKKEGIDFVVGRGRYKELARGQITGDRWGLLKILVNRRTLKLLGVHIVGDNAADLIHIGHAVMHLGGDVKYFIHSVFNYPTLAEAYKTAAFHAVNQIHGLTLTK